MRIIGPPGLDSRSSHRTARATRQGGVVRIPRRAFRHSRTTASRTASRAGRPPALRSVTRMKWRPKPDHRAGPLPRHRLVERIGELGAEGLADRRLAGQRQDGGKQRGISQRGRIDGRLGQQNLENGVRILTDLVAPPAGIEDPLEGQHRVQSGTRRHGPADRLPAPCRSAAAHRLPCRSETPSSRRRRRRITVSSLSRPSAMASRTYISSFT